MPTRFSDPIRRVAIAMLLGMAAPAVLAQDYSRSATLQCGDVRIEVETSCFDDSYRPFTACSRQTMVLSETTTGARKVFYAAKVPNADSGAGTTRSSLDRLVSAVACVRTGSRVRVEATFNTGGNCADCEAVRVYALDGSSLREAPGHASVRRVVASTDVRLRRSDR